MILKTQEQVAKEQSTIPKCLGNNHKEWTDCKGTFRSEDGSKYSGYYKNGTIIIASNIIPLLILDSPIVRSVNIIGTSITLTGTGVQTLMQTAVEGHLRGRVMSLYGMLHRGVPAIGALVVGGLAEFVGLSIAMIGIALIFCVGAAIWIYPRQKKIIQALETGCN